MNKDDSRDGLNELSFSILVSLHAHSFATNATNDGQAHLTFSLPNN